MPTRRLIGVAAALAASSIALLPSAASAARPLVRFGGHAVTLNAAPNPITAGDGVLLYGRLTGRHHQNQPVQLYHRLPGQPFFTLVQIVRTDTGGRYEFTRLPGVVDTNRAWFVYSDGAFSHRVRERVHAAITLNPLSSSVVVTGTPYTFTGQVAPNHVGERVELQRKQASGDDWRTIDAGRIGANGAYSITHVFRYPSGDNADAADALGDSSVRVHFRGDRRNIESSSDSLSLEINQKQNPNLGIASSQDPIAFGQSVTISSTVSASTAGQLLTLYSRTDGTAFAPVPGARVTAGASGSTVSFPAQAPTNNTLYRVVSANGIKSAALFEGVGDVVSASASTTAISVGQTVTFTGSVAPNKSGHVIYLQRRNPRTGDFHTVQVAFVGAGSQYSIAHRVLVAGAPAVFRVRVPGGPENTGGASGPIAIQVAPGPISG